MDENKSVQYTFDPDEKDILEKLNLVETSVNLRLQEKNQRELIATKYYSEFIMNTKKGPITLSNVFITIEQDQQGQKSYHFRWIKEDKNGEKSIEEDIVIGNDGKVYTIDGLKDYLGDAEIDIEELMAENEQIQVDENGIERSRLKGISEKVKTNDMEKDQKEVKEDETQEVENDLISQGQDLEIRNVRMIKDKHISERMPNVFDSSNEYAQAYSNKLGKFIILEKSNEDNGQWRMHDKIEPAQKTMRSVIAIDEQGKKIEKKVPYALMKTNEADKEIAVTIGQYGEINIETVDVLPCQERIARGVREQGEGLEKEESLQIRRDFETNGKEYKHNLAHQVEEIEDIQRENNQTVDYEITESDYIPNTKMTWGELMKQTGESLPKLVERFNQDMEKSSGNQDVDSIIKRIISDCQMVSHNREDKYN